MANLPALNRVERRHLEAKQMCGEREADSLPLPSWAGPASQANRVREGNQEKSLEWGLQKLALIGTTRSNSCISGKRKGVDEGLSRQEEQPGSG